LQLELEHEGYTTAISNDGRVGLEKALHGSFDLIILDVMLPSLSGMEVLRRVRQTSDVSIIMLTAKDDITDKVMGLDLGAQDYMTKPFAIEELLARIRVIFKLKNSQLPVSHSNCLKCGKLALDPDKFEASYNSILLALTKKEFELLHYLMLNKNMLLTRDNILENVWGYDYMGETNIVDVYIRYLRSKIDQKFEEKVIYTVRGMGYQLKDE
jgi:DNA-binding response OmpR family regulator